MLQWDKVTRLLSAQNEINYYDWRYILHNSYKVKTEFLSINLNYRSIGYICGYLVKDIHGRKVMHSFRGGFYLDKDIQFNRAESAIKEYAKNNNIYAINLYTLDSNELNFNPSSVLNTTLFIYNKDELWGKIGQKTRNMIRKGEKNNLKIREGIKYLDEFYKIYETTMLSYGVGIHTKEFVKNTLNILVGRSKLVVVLKENVVIAGIVLIIGESLATYWITASDFSYRKLSPNHFLIWSCISRLPDIKYFDMGEAKLGGGVHGFKKSFGGRSQQVIWHKIAPDIDYGFVNKSIKSLTALIKNIFIYHKSYNVLPRKILIYLLVRSRRSGRMF